MIIADADFHRPTLHRIANATPRKGFTDLLAGDEPAHGYDDADDGQCSARAARRRLDRAGPHRPGYATGWRGCSTSMSDEADYVLIDSSPILLIPDNLYMAAAADGIILVVAVGQTRSRDILRTKAPARAGRHSDHRRRAEPDPGEASELATTSNTAATTAPK